MADDTKRSEFLLVNGASMRIVREDELNRARQRCDACRYWIPVACHGECLLIRHTSDNNSRPIDGSARVDVDYETSGYGGRLQTSAAFGCVLWEAKREVQHGW